MPYSSQSHPYNHQGSSYQPISNAWSNHSTATGVQGNYTNTPAGGYQHDPGYWAARQPSQYSYTYNSGSAVETSNSTWDSPSDTGSTGREASITNEEIHDYRPLVTMREEDLIPSWLREATQNGKKAWECKGCGQGFARKQHGYYHVLKQHFNQDKLFECRVCKEQFNSENSARRHRDHQQRRFSCTICHKVFARRDYCRLHQQRCQERYF